MLQHICKRRETISMNDIYNERVPNGMIEVFMNKPGIRR